MVYRHPIAPCNRAARSILFIGGIASLLLSTLNDVVREAMLMHYHLLSITTLILIFVAILPERVFLLALPFGAAALFGLMSLSELKVQAVGLPITYLDFVTTARDPRIVLHALGYRGSLAIPGLLVGLVAILLVAGVARRALSAPGRLALTALELGALTVSSALALNAAGRDLRDKLPTLFPAVEQDLWEPAGQQALMRSAGPLEYLAFTRLAGDSAAVAVSNRRAPPLPVQDIRAAERRHVNFTPAAARLLPNIVFLHAESTFDPGMIFRLSAPVLLPIWTRRGETRFLGPLLVNAVGGGTWITEFEVLTGVDSRGFGYQGFYTHQTIAPRVKMAFPRFLAEKGYETVAYYTEKGDFFNVAKAFQRYGFQRFYDGTALGLAPDWSDSDRVVVERVISHGAFNPSVKPRLLFISTQENHGPHACVNFHGPNDLIVRLPEGAGFDQECSLNEYIRRAASTSAAFEAVLDQLQRLERETGRPFVLLVYGDHQPWSFTDGKFSVAGGTADDPAMTSFAKFRRGDNSRITFYHLLASRPDALVGNFDAPLPATLLPTLVSAYAAKDSEDVYLPVNLLAYDRCGSMDRACPLRADLDLWGRNWLFQRGASTREGR